VFDPSQCLPGREQPQTNGVLSSDQDDRPRRATVRCPSAAVDTTRRLYDSMRWAGFLRPVRSEETASHPPRLRKRRRGLGTAELRSVKLAYCSRSIGAGSSAGAPGWLWSPLCRWAEPPT